MLDLQFILGQQVVEIAAITDGQTSERPLEDLATMCLRFDGGAIGMVCCGMRLPESQNDVAIYGSHGKVVLSDASWPRLQGELRVSSETVNTTVAYEPDFVALVTRNIEDFQRAIVEDRDPAASGVDGLKLVQVTEGMVESAKTGRMVKLAVAGSLSGAPCDVGCRPAGGKERARNGPQRERIRETIPCSS